MKVTLTLALTLATLLAPATAGAAERQARVHGGAPVDIADVPFQAYVEIELDDGRTSFCGGSIRDRQHVITAAHCVYDYDDGEAALPSQVAVLVGTDDLTQTGPPAQVRAAAGVSFDPRYHHYTQAFDAAVITLDQPLSPFPTANVAPATLIPASTWSGIDNLSSTRLLVSGWGEVAETDEPSLSLQEAEVPLVPDADCDQRYASMGGIREDAMVCAGDDTRDSCRGDSGGPLSYDGPSAGRDLLLAGIVSFGGQECSVAAEPGVYTELAEPSIRARVTEPDPAAAPRASARAEVRGTARVGDTLTCVPVGFAGATSLEYEFLRSVVGGAVILQPRGPSDRYTVRSADTGGRVSCEAVGTYAGGNVVGFSGPSDLVGGDPAPPAPQPAPPAQNVPPVVPPSPPALPPFVPRPVPSAQDRVAPVARIAKVRCARSRCTLDARVSDAGFSSGLRKLEVKLVSRYRTRCARGKRRVPCTRIRARTLRATALGATSFRVRVRGLPAGRHTFTLRAVDVAGNRQAIPARRTVRTR